jgi:hypothetical protein
VLSFLSVDDRCKCGEHGRRDCVFFRAVAELKVRELDAAADDGARLVEQPAERASKDLSIAGVPGWIAPPPR